MDSVSVVIAGQDRCPKAHSWFYKGILLSKEDYLRNYGDLQKCILGQVSILPTQLIYSLCNKLEELRSRSLGLFGVQTTSTNIQRHRTVQNRIFNRLQLHTTWQLLNKLLLVQLKELDWQGFFPFIFFSFFFFNKSKYFTTLVTHCVSRCASCQVSFCSDLFTNFIIVISQSCAAVKHEIHCILSG